MGTRPARQLEQFRAAHPLNRGCAGIVVDALFHDRSVQIVGPEPERDLRNPRRHHHPIRLDVGNVIQHQARDGDILNVVESGGLGNMVQRGVVGMKRKRDEGHEAMRFVLQSAQAY